MNQQYTDSHETSKARVARIPLRYFKRTTRPVLLKYLLSCLACLAAVGYAVMACLPANPEGFSHGPLSRAHSHLSCSDCHLGNLWTPVSKTAVFASPSSIRATNKKCNSCHFKGSSANQGRQNYGNGTHHWGETKLAVSNTESCLDCHHEHRGPGEPLIDVADRACIRCHDNLNQIRKSKGEGVLSFDPRTSEAQTDFDRHPEFRALANPDPGVLKFNHALHLRAGIHRPGNANMGWEVTRNEAIQSRYAPVSTDNQLIQLNCADCHQPTAEGALMKPISYEQHCQACHPIDGSGRIEHGLDQDTVKRQLSAYFAWAKSQKRAATHSELARYARPGQPSGAQTTVPWESMEEAVRGSVERELQRLYGQEQSVNLCYFCHHLPCSTEANDVFKVKWMSPPESQRQKLMIPHRWLDRGRFDHSAHRMLDCEKCHDVSELQIDRPTDDQHVLLPSIDVCRQCHGKSQKAMGAWASAASCTKCHDYHSEL